MTTRTVREKNAQGQASRLTLRVYYEDTDFSGRVYHASYLRFLERGRTEWLRERGFEQREMAKGVSIVFVVRRLTIDFLKAAAMDDLLTIETRLALLGAASFDFSQVIICDETTIATALVGVVALKGDRPARLPQDLRARLLNESATSNPSSH
jgi:acyl-CoA thioester hydrolase